MDFIVNLIYAGFLICGGYLLVKFRRNVKSWTGDFMWAERALGRGGTYIIIILLGLGMIFIGVLYPFGGIELLIGNTITK